ncbi:MAG: hypothetical protein GC205_00855, partial [Bacteroidetes bacterium]|nr:hypothetical protein [Bacteroidota bacterium]
MKNIYRPALLAVLFAGPLASFAQPCDPTFPPVNLEATYTPGSGVLLEWDGIPGSVAARLRVNLPGGMTFNRNIIGAEPDQFFVPETFLVPGSYSWRVLAAC